MQQIHLIKLKSIILCLMITTGLVACSNKLPETKQPVTTQNEIEVPLTSEQLWQQHQHNLQQISSFKVNGSLAYFSNKTKHYARFYLNQKSRSNYHLRLTTPLGGTVMELIVKPNLVELIDQDGEKYQSNDVELMLFELTNMNIPLKSLHNWILGLSNNKELDIINSNGYLKETEFTQQNETWKLKILAYNTKNKVALPSQLELSHKDDIIKLKMNTWTL